MSRGWFLAVLAPLSALALVTAFSSLQWRAAHDAPIMLYMAWLVDQGHAVPYRDFFDMNLPGSYWAYALLGRVSGYADFGLRAADLAYLAAISAVTWGWMRRFGWQCAWASVVVFALEYLGGGPILALQREYLLLLPIAGAVWLSDSQRVPEPARFLGVGLLFGVTAIVKPHAAIALPVLWLFHGRGLPLRESLARIVAPSALGFALPPLAALGYLWRVGALGELLDMARNYWPLYARFTNESVTIAGASRLEYLVAQLVQFGSHRVWVAAAALGVFGALHGASLDRARRRQVVLLVLLAIAYAGYTLFSGQFFGYHWLPFLYFVFLASSLCLVERPGVSRAARALPLIAFGVAIALSIRPPAELRLELRGQPPAPLLGGRVDAIAGYLESHLAPGDTVQPLDWTGGAVHAMLIARARLATRFVYDFHFYHHVSSPYIQGLRRRFMAELAAAPPRFIVQIDGERKPWPKGPDTTREFPELQQLLAAHYAVVTSGENWAIYELRK